MINWFKYPFIRLLIPFASGIWIGLSFSSWMPLPMKSLLLLLLITYTLLILISIFVKNYTFRYLFGVFLNINLALLGFSMTHIHDNKLNIKHINNIGFTPEFWVARLVESPTEKENSIKIILDIIGAETDTFGLAKVEGSIMCYFEKCDSIFPLKYGDVIAFTTDPEIVEPPPNPEQFNYKEYLSRKGIEHQVYLKSDAWISLEINKANIVYRFSYWLRDFLLMTMKDLGIQGDEYAVAAAILLGYDDTLPPELRQSYVTAGTMHILCVSGLHVGVIFIVFSYMLIFLNKRKGWQNILKQGLLFLLIWLYALLAGLAPSILRATIMLSFVIIGALINRRGVLMNSIAASAFILLCMRPANLLEIGFLLSYIAVIGIVVLQKPIFGLFYFKWKLINKMWEMTSVTLSAQIATAPFTIYYFHQFPLYFWLSNLFMTPISSIVITGGMIMLLIFFIPYVNVFIAWLVSKMIFVMNFVVIWIESLPMSIIKGLYINELEFIIAIVALLSLLLLINLREKKIFYSFISLLLIFSVIHIRNALCLRNRTEMFVYNINKVTAIDFVSGNQHILFADSILIHDDAMISYNIENNWVKHGVCRNGKRIDIREDYEDLFVKKKGNLISFNGKLMAILKGEELQEEDLPYHIPVDYLLLCTNKSIDVDRLSNEYDFGMIILDGSVPQYRKEELIEEFEIREMPYYLLENNGTMINFE